MDGRKDGRIEGWMEGEVDGWKGCRDGNNGMEEVEMGGWKDGGMER